MTPRTVALAGALALFALAAGPWGPAPAAAQPDATHKDFLPDGKYRVFVNREPDDDAVVAHARRAAAYLVLTRLHPKPVLLTQRDQKVVEVEPADVIEQEGVYALRAGFQARDLGRFRVEGGDIAIASDSFRARLSLKPPLEGWAGRDRVLKHSPEYGRDGTAIDAAVVQTLRGETDPTRVVIFFGTWCPMCKQYMGRVLKTEAMVGPGTVEFAYYGLPQAPAAWDDLEFKRNGVERLPSAHVFDASGRERGRLSGNEFQDFARNLARFVR
jgi:hypothetical protein